MTAARPDSTEGPLILRFRPTLDDMIAASDLIWRGTYRRLAVIAGVVIVVGSVIGWAIGDDPMTLAVADIAAALAIVLLLTGRIRQSLSRRVMGRKYRSLAGDDEVVMAITPRGIRTQQGASTTLVGWADVTDTLESEGVIVLLKGRSPRVLIPKHGFPTAATLAAFRAAIAHGGITARATDNGESRPSGL